MIVPMKKLSLLLFYKEKEAFLELLRDQGVVHIVENEGAVSSDLEILSGEKKNIDHVLTSIKALAKAQKTSAPAKNSTADPEEIILRYEELDAKKDKIEQQLQDLRKKITILEPWGNFDYRAIGKLKDSNITMRFFEISDKKYDSLKQLDIAIEEVSRRSGMVNFIALEHGEIISLDADEVSLPEISLSTAIHKVQELEKEKLEVEKAFLELTKYQDILHAYCMQKKSKLDFEKARLSMEDGADGKVVSLTGWIPADNGTSTEKRVSSFLEGFSAWYSIDAPTIDDNVPVLLKNKKSSALFEMITNIFSLPNYFEIDPTPFFAPFFALFFGLCLGDLGYGAVLLVAGLFAMKFVPKKLKPVFILLSVLGFMTMLGGVMLNTVFGHAIFTVGGDVGFLESGAALAPLSPIQTASGKYFPAMPFALYLGVIQTILGVGLKGYNQYKNDGFVYLLHPLGNILMIIGATIFMAQINFIELGKFSFGIVAVGPFLSSLSNEVPMAFIAAGAILLFLFNNPSKGVLVRFGIGIWELYGFATGLMSDALSYLRLFALGLASGLLGAAFNNIALMMIANDGGNGYNYSSPLIIVTILIIVVGHTLNLGLALLGSFVHPLRLTFVEFYKNLNFRGGSKGYVPFARAEAGEK